MLLKDFIISCNNAAVICKGFIDGITQYKHVATLWPYANRLATNEIIGCILYIFSKLSTNDLEQLWKFGDNLDSFYTEIYSNNIIDVPWGEVDLTPNIILALTRTTNIIDTWRTQNGWENSGWVTKNVDNIVFTKTDVDTEYPSNAKNEFDNQPPYVETTITSKNTTLVLIIQRNKTEIKNLLFNVAVNTLKLPIGSIKLFPAVGIGTIVSTVLFITLQQLKYMPVPIDNTSCFGNSLNIINYISSIILSNINVLKDSDCHPRLKSHSVIKHVSKDVMISLAKIIETSF